jgi:Flp pilus assembly protein TadD
MAKRKQSVAKGRLQAPAPQLVEASNLYQRGEYRAAIAVLSDALTAQPYNAQLWNLAGASAWALGLVEDAEGFLRSAIAAQPDTVEAYYNLAVILQQTQRQDEACILYRKLLKLRPNHIEALHNLAVFLQERGDFGEAESLFRREIAAGSQNPSAYTNLGVLLQKRNCLEEAETLYQKALAIKLDQPAALNGYGSLLIDLHQHYEEAEACLKRAITLRPEWAYPRWNLALALLGQGKLEEGWPLYEARYASFDGKPPVDTIPPAVPFPQWRGESLAGKSLLVWYEQGYGDAVQFCRYVPLLKAQGAAQISLYCKPPLQALLKTLPGVDVVCAAEKDRTPPLHDYWTFPLSIPLHLRTTLDTIPANLPYLAPLPERLRQWQERLPSQGLKVGLVWKGSSVHKNDVNRSLSGLSTLAPLWSARPDVTFISLQKGTGEDEARHPPADQPLLDLGGGMQDFADMAAVVSQLDLVICVDTAIAHVAGALKKPCWVLLPCVGTDWRWFRGRSDSPWYPGVMRLFRQSAANDWTAVIEEVAQALKEAPAHPLPDYHLTVPDAPLAPSAAAAAAAAAPADETQRRKAVIAQKQTDTERWANPEQLEAAWAARSKLAASFIPAGARVIDLGCGAMHVERFLPYGCSYVPVDVTRRDERTLICDLNRDPPPLAEIARADMISMLGVWEYLYEPAMVFRALASVRKPLICSYCVTEMTQHLDRGALGWVNAFSSTEFVAMAEAAGFRLQTQTSVDGIQKLFRFVPKEDVPVSSVKRVHVISYFNVGNFGDRLGFHLLNDVLPASAVVTWGTVNPLQPPPENTDLVILGIGNSMFGNLLNAGILKVAESFPTIGIFGTQYRSEWPAARLQSLLDRLVHWYARYEDDTFIYGRGRSNVSHFGDWLIKAFPMASATIDERLIIDNQVFGELPLDRVIQKIQRHKKVYSWRLHPLLCALTSAERVAYKEQHENGNDAVASGKFRSMLIDIFGQAWSEDTEWPVDRDAVLRYKARIAANVDGLAQDLRKRLG